MRSLQLIGLALVALGVSGESCPDVGGDWSTVTLDPSINYIVHHKVVESTLHLRLSAQHTGWLGFGFAESSSGHMKGSDLVTAGVSTDGKVYAQDRYADFAPTTYSAATNYVNDYQGLTASHDVHDDYTIVSGSEVGGVTEVWVTRPLATGDTQDRDVLSGSTRIVWSWGSSDTPAYHGSNRGAGTIRFFGTASGGLGAYDGVWTRHFDAYAMPSEYQTAYACQGFTFPTDRDRHIVGFRPINVSKYNHHAILHICQENEYFGWHTSPQLCSYHAQDNPGVVSSHTAGSSPLGSETAGCSGLVWSWAVGMGDVIFPEAAGLRIGSGTGKVSHVILEIHYDNPAGDTGHVDNMGFQAFYVDTPRANDLGMIIVGDPIVQLDDVQSTAVSQEVGNLPQGQALIHREASCPTECTQDFTGPVTAFGHLLHMHHYGRKMYTERYDSTGTFLGMAGNRIDFWDNGYQQMQVAEYTINPGDSLQTHCYFSTQAKSDGEVEFSTPTYAEMCQDFIFYYPAQLRNNLNFAMCGISGAGTLCGSLDQGHSVAFLPFTTQVARGDARYTDPLSFTVANRPEKPSVNADQCTTAPPSPPPVSPPSMPASLPRVTFEVVASGDVSDYSQSVIDGIRISVAATLEGVDRNAVEVTVTSASVLISVSIVVADAAAVTSVTNQVSTNLASPTAATAFLTSQLPAGSPSVSVTEVRTLPGASGVGVGVIVGAAVGGVVGLLLIFILISVVLKKGPVWGLIGKQAEGKTSTKV